MKIASSDSKQLGKQIRLARINKGFKQYELAEHINVTANYVSLIESGKKSPSLHAIRNIAKALNVRVSSLLGEDPILKDLQEISLKYDIDALIKGLEQIKNQALA